MKLDCRELAKFRALGGGSGGGGGSVAGVHVVTFMSEDGATELYKRPVADGDDCADVVERGLIPAPTKESTVQYTYTHVGWANTANGAWDQSALKAVTEDKTVYAAFAAAVRYYTITYYDGDGTTVLKRDSLVYGAMPSYSPEKDGYSFEGWQPSLATVTGDADYTAQWAESLAFGDASWTRIAEVSASGNAANVFKVGDMKDVPITYEDGTTGTITVAIAGFNHDTLPGGGKAGISLVCMSVPDYTIQWIDGSSYNSSSYYPYAWTGGGSYTKSSAVRTALNSTVFNMLPEELRNVIKPVLKKCDIEKSTGTTPTIQEAAETLWALSLDEMGHSSTATYEAIGGTHYSALGSKYDLFTSQNVLPYQTQPLPIVKVEKTDTNARYWTRHVRRAGSWNIMFIDWYYAKEASASESELVTTKRHVRFGFCV